MSELRSCSGGKANISDLAKISDGSGAASSFGQVLVRSTRASGGMRDADWLTPSESACDWLTPSESARERDGTPDAVRDSDGKL
jgi:hypothetical protein